MRRVLCTKVPHEEAAFVNEGHCTVASFEPDVAVGQAQVVHMHGERFLKRCGQRRCRHGHITCDMREDDRVLRA